jgi:molybdopterin molybdotransferase
LTGLLSVQEAQARILSFFQAVDEEAVPVAQCAGRTLAKDISAPGDLPPFANSGMDGFAVRAADVQAATANAPVRLKIIADIPAGSTTSAILQTGQAARIMTGAPLPGGADAVVPVEDTDLHASLPASSPAAQVPEQVSVLRGVRVGDFVRPRGQDVRQGQTLLNKGRKLQPQDTGILAAIGLAQVQVFRRPRVALFSSGDELVPPGQALKPGQIYDSNSFMLAAILEREGAQVIRLGNAPDDPDQIELLLSKAITQQVDLIVTSAGVSVGAFDFVRQVIEAKGSLDFWKVNMRPGKPLAFGSFSGIPLISLPGNPVSAFVGCRVFVIPVMRKLSGREQVLSPRRKAVIDQPIESDGRESYLRAIVQNQGGKLAAILTGHQGSGNLFSLVQANALLIVPSEVKSLPSGTEVEIWFFDDD